MKKYIDSWGNKYVFKEQGESETVIQVFNEHGQITSEMCIASSMAGAFIDSSVLTELGENHD